MNKACMTMTVLMIAGSFQSANAQVNNTDAVAPVISLLLLDGGERFKAVVTGLLNDTGIIFGADESSGLNVTCTSDIAGPQDCDQGRDASDNDNSDGYAGFSFSKLNSAGEILLADATEWNCVGDNVTGLMWEGKTTNGNLFDMDDLFTWYSTNTANNGGAVGEDNSATDSCFGYQGGVAATYCNTQAYVARVNASKLCGYSDWRMPQVGESLSLADQSTPSGLPPSGAISVDLDYFPNNAPLHTWVANAYASDSTKAWILIFDIGGGTFIGKDNSYRVRLVRGAP